MQIPHSSPHTCFGGRGRVDPSNIRNAVREWPIRPTTFLRLFLLLVIPVGSWVGGAMVERMLGRLLD